MTEKNYYEGVLGLDAVQTQVHYAKWAASYDGDLAENEYATPGRCGDAAAEFVSNTAVRVLDMGCGTGLAGAALQGRGFTSIVGCDYSPEMLVEAEKTGAYERLFEVDLNARPLNIADRSYGLITAAGAIGSSHIRVDVVDEIVRLLIDDGIFVVGVNESWWFEGSLRAKIDALESGGSITVELRERGAHMPSHDVMGWVIVGRKCQVQQ